MADFFSAPRLSSTAPMAASQAATVSTRGSTRPSTGAWPKICVATMQQVGKHCDVSGKPPRSTVLMNSGC